MAGLATKQSERELTVDSGNVAEQLEETVSIRGLRLSAIAADFYAAAETQARQLCARLSLPGAESQTIPGAPPGAHAGAARLRLAFARAWQLQEASLLVALRSCAAGRLNDARIEMKSLRRMVEESARCLRRQLAYAESCKATICGAQRGARDGSGPNGPGGLGARVSLSLALATFSQGIKRRHEVLHSPEAYNAWLQEMRRDWKQRDPHLDDLSKTEHPKLPGGNDEAPVEVANPPAKPVSKGKILEEAGYTVLHEALGGCASRPRVTSNVQLSQEEEMQLRRDSRSAWRSCEPRDCGNSVRSVAPRLPGYVTTTSSRLGVIYLHQRKVCDLLVVGDLQQRNRSSCRRFALDWMAVHLTQMFWKDEGDDSSMRAGEKDGRGLGSCFSSKDAPETPLEVIQKVFMRGKRPMAGSRKWLKSTKPTPFSRGAPGREAKRQKLEVELESPVIARRSAVANRARCGPEITLGEWLSAQAKG
eukprot:g28888.t1